MENAASFQILQTFRLHNSKFIENHNERKEFQNKLRDKRIVEMSVSMVEGGINTDLQLIIIQLLQETIVGNQEKDYTILLLMLFALQAETLPEQANHVYIHQCNTLFSTCCVEYAKLVSKEITAITNCMAKIGCSGIVMPRSMIRSLMLAVRIVAPSPVCLTPSHSHLLQVCLGDNKH